MSKALFAQSGGAKLFAAKDKVELEAQSDQMLLTSLQAMKMTSLSQLIELSAKREILLTSGGAYIRIKAGNIEIHAPGTIDVKGAKKTFSGPASLSHTYKDMPLGPASGMYDEQTALFTTFGMPLENVAVEVEVPGEETRVYFTDEDGAIPRLFNEKPVAGKTRLVPDELIVPAGSDEFVPRKK